MSSLQGKKVVVTGSSRGIGAGIAHHLATQGAQVCITYSTNADSAESLLAELPGSGHICQQLNIGDEDSIKDFFTEVFKNFESLDGLVNNAGITRDQILLRMKTEDFDDVIRTNLRGAFLCTKAVMKPMVKARQGSIVNITSIIGQTGNAGQANYAASKAGLEAFTKSVAREVAPRNIRANCVAPGFIRTDMTDSLEEKVREATLAQIPMGRFGGTEDVAGAVRFLLSDESGYITGQTITVNGGLST